MKKLFVTLCLACIAMTMSAQKMPTENLNETQARFYEGCTYLREGALKNSLSTLDEAISLLDESKNNPDRIVLQDLYVELEDAKSDTVSMEGHMYFSGGYAQHLYEQKEEPYIETASSLRSVAKGECFVNQNAVRANGTVEYRVKMVDSCNVFVMSESGGKINLTVKDEGNGSVYEGTPYEDGSVSYVEWEQSQQSQDAVLVIENKTDKDISFVIATN